MEKNQLLHQIYAFADALNTHLIDSYQTVHSNVVRFNEIYIQMSDKKLNCDQQVAGSGTFSHSARM